MKHKILIFVLVIVLTLFLFISAFVLMINPKGYDLGIVIRNFLIDTPICLIVGFIDYYLLYILHKKFWSRISAFSIISEVLGVSCIIGLLAFVSFTIVTKNPFAQILSFLIWNGIIILFVELYLYGNAQTENEKRIIEIEREKAIYQFNALKNQINPHFLFNSLNVLSALAYQSPELTNHFAKKLSNVYRYLLTTAQHPSVTLEKEMRFMETYVYLEKTRFEDCLEILVNDYRRWSKYLVIPASVQILVENAIKHNIATSELPLRINVTINDDGIRVANNLQLRNNVTKSGVGLENLKKQYAIFGQKIEVAKTDSIFSVSMPFLDNQSNSLLQQ